MHGRQAEAVCKTAHNKLIRGTVMYPRCHSDMAQPSSCQQATVLLVVRVNDLRP